MLTQFDYHGNKINIPLRILNTLQAADFSDDQIYLMTPRERFYAYCDYEGLIHWGDILWECVEESLASGSQIAKQAADTAAKAARWDRLERIWSKQKTSASQRILADLGIDGDATITLAENFDKYGGKL